MSISGCGYLYAFPRQMREPEASTRFAMSGPQGYKAPGVVCRTSLRSHPRTRSLPSTSYPSTGSDRTQSCSRNCKPSYSFLPRTSLLGQPVRPLIHHLTVSAVHHGRSCPADERLSANDDSAQTRNTFKSPSACITPRLRSTKRDSNGLTMKLSPMLGMNPGFAIDSSRL